MRAMFAVARSAVVVGDGLKIMFLDRLYLDGLHFVAHARKLKLAFGFKDGLQDSPSLNTEVGDGCRAICYLYNLSCQAKYV